MLNEYPDVLTVVELARVLRIGENAAYDLVNRHAIASLKIGRKHLIPKQYLIDFLNSKRYNVGEL